MLMYWVMFFALAVTAFSRMKPLPVGVKAERWTSGWWLAWALMTLFIGLREQVGADWVNYVGQVEKIQGVPFDELWAYGEPAYSLLNWIGANQWGWVYLPNFVSAMIFAWGLIDFSRAQPRPWLVMLVAAPYLITVVAMGYTRQGVAIGLAMVGINALLKGSMWRYFLWIGLAGTFHKSAVMLIPLAIFSDSKRYWINLAGVVVIGIVLFVLLLQESVDALKANYIDAAYDSGGAFIRIAMNALPAMLFIWFRKRFALTERERSFWTWMASIALAFIPLLYLSPSSTAVDRVALYWIPLQLFVWGRLPDALGKPGKKNEQWNLMVIGYSALVLFVWLLFANHAFAWLPYRFLPWEWLWT